MSDEPQLHDIRFCDRVDESSDTATGKIVRIAIDPHANGCGVIRDDTPMISVTALVAVKGLVAKEKIEVTLVVKNRGVPDFGTNPMVVSADEQGHAEFSVRFQIDEPAARTYPIEIWLHRKNQPPHCLPATYTLCYQS